MRRGSAHSCDMLPSIELVTLPRPDGWPGRTVCERDTPVSAIGQRRQPLNGLRHRHVGPVISVWSAPFWPKRRRSSSPCAKRQLAPLGQLPVCCHTRHMRVLFCCSTLKISRSDMPRFSFWSSSSPCAKLHWAPSGHVPVAIHCSHSLVLYWPYMSSRRIGARTAGPALCEGGGGRLASSRFASSVSSSQPCANGQFSPRLQLPKRSKKRQSPVNEQGRGEAVNKKGGGERQRMSQCRGAAAN